MEYQNELLEVIINDVKDEVLNKNHYEHLLKDIDVNNYNCENEELLVSVLEYCENQLERTSDQIIGHLFEVLFEKSFKPFHLNYVYDIDPTILREDTETEYGLNMSYVEEMVKERFEEEMKYRWFYEIDFNEIRDEIIYEEAVKDTDNFFNEFNEKLIELLTNEIKNHKLFKDIEEAYVLSVKI